MNSRKNESLFKSKIQMVIYLFIFGICVILFIIIGKTDFKKFEDSDNLKFHDEYNMVSEENVYKYSNASDILSILNGRDGIILLGFPKNEWTSYYAEILNNVCKKLNINEVYYYNFLKDREDNNGTYEKIVEILDNYVLTDDLGNKDLNAPSILIVKRGRIINYYSDHIVIMGNIKPKDYFNVSNRDTLYTSLYNDILNYKG